MTFDCSKTPPMRAASEQGYRFELKQPPYDTPIGVYITVRGPESEQVREHLGRQIQAEAAREVRARKRGREVEPRSIDEREAEFIELAVACTMAWEGFEDAGVPMQCTPEKARKLYTDYSWIRAQVVREALDLGNFVRSSSKSCSSTPVPSIG